MNCAEHNEEGKGGGGRGYDSSSSSSSDDEKKKKKKKKPDEEEEEKYDGWKVPPEPKRRKTDGGGGGGGEDEKSSKEEMLERLSKEREMGMFRKVRSPYWAAVARKEIQKDAAGRLPDAMTAFSSGAAYVLRLRTVDGPILAREYRGECIRDEHIYCVQFKRSQLDKDVHLTRQAESKTSREYHWTRFKTEGVIGVDVYYAGDDPFAPPRPPIPTTAAAVLPTAAPPAVAKGQTTLAKFFDVPERKEEEGKKGKKKSAGSPFRKKHGQFARNVFYVNVRDVVAVKE